MVTRGFQEYICIGPHNPAQHHTVNNTNILKLVQSYSLSVDTISSLVSNIGSNPLFVNGYPNISLDLSFLATNGTNERFLGLYTNGTNDLIPSGISCKVENIQPNIFIVKVPGIEDAIISKRNDIEIVGLGNCFLNSYSMSAQVGQQISCQASFDCLNLKKFKNRTGIGLPSVYATGVMNEFMYSIPSGDSSDVQQIQFDLNEANKIFYLGHKDIVFSIASGGMGFEAQNEISGYNISSFSFSISFDRNRTNLFHGKYGKNMKFASFPRVSLSVSLISEGINVAHIKDIACQNPYDIKVYLKQNCSDILGMELDFRGLKLESISESNDIANIKIVSLQFIGEIHDSTSLTNNLFVTAYGGTIQLVAVANSHVSFGGSSISGVLPLSEVYTYKKVIAENTF